LCVAFLDFVFHFAVEHHARVVCVARADGLQGQLKVFAQDAAMTQQLATLLTPEERKTVAIAMAQP
jgi:hypothetical protein